MTFSQLTKEEVQKAVRHLDDCCADAFMYAVFKSLGSFSLRNRTFVLCVVTENNELLHIMQRLAKQKFGVQGNIQSENTNVMRGSIIYSEIFDDYITEYYGFTYRDSDNLLQICENTDSKFFSKACCKRTFIQALMLACGSITVPTVSSDLKESCSTLRYHLEFVFSDADFAETVKDLLQEIGFAFKTTKRKHNTVLYIKDSSLIGDFLVYINASGARLMLENIIIERSIRNNVNRQSNCISANIDKAVESSRKQVNAIEILKKNGTLDTLSVQLKEVADLRLNNPEATLQELAVMSGLSKSGIRHRLDKLVELSKDIITKEND